MKSGDIIRGAYALTERLGQSAFGETWAAAATDGCPAAAPGSPLVVKILRLGDMPDWKGFERFEAEAAALKAMSHPSIPRYVDSFRLDEGREAALVMERAPGRSLAAEAESGRRWTEPEIERMVAELLSILAYVHSLRPPIIHRDVNPKNIMLKPDGGLCLVDFSGVQDAVRLAFRDTSTMLGTAGYAPLEQVSGRASVRSDLYAAAATAAFLVTRVPPSDLPLRGMRLDPGAVVELSPRLSYVLDNYLDPDEAGRTLPPAEAAAILRGERTVPHDSLRRAQRPPAERSPDIADDAGYGAPEPYFGPSGDGPTVPARARADTLPSDSRVRLSVERGRFVLEIPRAGFKGATFWLGGGFTLFWLGFIAFWTFSAITMGAPLVFPLFSLPFWAAGVFMARTFLRPALVALELTMTPDEGLVYAERSIGKARVRSWPLSDLGACAVGAATVTTSGQKDTEIVLEAGSRSLRFGRLLSKREQRAVAAAIESWLDAARRPND